MDQIVLNDLHFPDHSRTAISAAEEVLNAVNPGRIDLLGDICDTRTMSTKFRSVPKKARFGKLIGELKPAKQFLENLRGLFPKAKIVFHEGNHEHRITKWIAHNAQQLDGLLDVPTLLGLEKLRIEHRPYGHLERVGHLRITHGDLIRKGSGMTARAMLEKYGCPILFGHTHRGGSVLKSSGDSVQGAWENFCLCRLDPDYQIGPPDWQQGLSWVHHTQSRFHVVQVPIIKGTAMLGPELLKGDTRTSRLLKGVG